MNWKSISLKDLDLISEVETTDEVDYLSGIVSILKNIPVDEVKEWKLKKLLKWNNKLSFLNQLPKASNKNYFWYKGVLYVRRNFEEMSAGEFIDCDQILNSNDPDGLKMAKVIRILFRPFGKKYKGLIDDFFYDMKCAKSYSLAVFFYIGAKKSFLRGIEAFLIQEMKKKATKEGYQKVLEIQSHYNALKKTALLNGTHLFQQ